MSELTLNKFKNENEEPTIDLDDVVDVSEAIALYLKKNFNASSQKEVLLEVSKILEDWYVEKIAVSREVLEKQEQDLKNFNS